MGGVLGGGSDSSSKSQGQSVVDPAQQDFLQRLRFGALGQVSGLDIQDGSGRFYGGKLDYFPGQTVADRSPFTDNAYLAYSALANAQGGQSAQAGEQENLRTLGGAYLTPDSNPFIRATYDKAARAVTDNYQRSVAPDITSRFARAGQRLSGGRQAAMTRANEALGDSLSDLATGIYGDNYARERGYQTAAIDRAPSYEQAARARIQGLRDIGTEDLDYRQRRLDSEIARFEFNRDEPFNRLGRFSSLIGQPVVTSNQSARSTNASTEGIFGVIGRLLGF